MKTHAYLYAFHYLNGLPTTLPNVYAVGVYVWGSQAIVHGGPERHFNLHSPLHSLQKWLTDKDLPIEPLQDYLSGSNNFRTDIGRFTPEWHLVVS